MLFKKILPFLCVFVLCSCTQSKTITPILNNIAFLAEIKYFNEDYVCDASFTDNEAKITVIEPEEISGLSFILKDGKVTAEYMGIKYSPDTNKMLSGNVAVVLDGVIRTVHQGEYKAVSNGDNCKIKGEYNGKNFDFVFSPQGLPLKLSIEDEIKINFKNVTLK